MRRPQAGEEDAGVEGHRRNEREHLVRCHVPAHDARTLRLAHEPACDVLQRNDLRRLDAPLEPFDQHTVARVERGEPPHEALERRADVGIAERAYGIEPELGRRLRNDGGKQRVLRREAAEDGAVADARPARDLVDARVDAQLREADRSRVENAVAVSLGVDAKRAHRAGAASAWMFSTCCERSIASITTSPTATNATVPPNAQWNPCTSDAWESPTVRLAASVLRIASPSTPPTCCDVLNSPDASPWSVSSRPVVAIRVSGTKTAPIPSETSSSEGRKSVR